jgi:uncharacterized membrane protein
MEWRRPQAWGMFLSASVFVAVVKYYFDFICLLYFAIAVSVLPRFYAEIAIILCLDTQRFMKSPGFSSPKGSIARVFLSVG